MHAQDLSLEIIQNQYTTCRIVCPECGPYRKKKHERTLSISVSSTEIMYNCWHCPLSGKLPREPYYSKYMNPEPTPAPNKVTRIPTCLNDSTTKITEFFAARGYPIGPLSDLPPMVTGRKWYRGPNMELDSIGFIYGTIENTSAIKWRPLGSKEFTQDGSARTFYGLDTLPDELDTLIITEGEPDTIALASIGIKSVSVPNGAPKMVSEQRISPEEDHKFAYIWAARDIIEKCGKIVIATDSDGPGDALAEEIARRIGRAKCWRVQFPAELKDADNVLRERGADALRTMIEDAEPMPLEGIYSAADYDSRVQEIYKRGHGHGSSTGIDSVDELFTVGEGLLYVVTGLPSGGKSEFIDQLAVNLANSDGWKWAVGSFENEPHTHIAKLSEKIVGKPFYEGVTPRMSEVELSDATAFLGEHFVFLDSKDGCMTTIDSILDRARQAVMRLGVRGLIIDPYNYIEPESDSEHKSVSLMLTKVTSFAKAHGVAVFFVAHPKTLQPGRDGTFPLPTGMHISGGVTWFAKADIGITVHRGDKGVEIHNWKTRHKWMGKQGMTYLNYDVPTGRYSDHIGMTPPTGPISQWSGNKYADKFTDIDPDDLEF